MACGNEWPVGCHLLKWEIPKEKKEVSLLRFPLFLRCLLFWGGGGTARLTGCFGYLTLRSLWGRPSGDTLKAFISKDLELSGSYEAK